MATKVRAVIAAVSRTTHFGSIIAIVAGTHATAGTVVALIVMATEIRSVITVISRTTHLWARVFFIRTAPIRTVISAISGATHFRTHAATRTIIFRTVMTIITWAVKVWTIMTTITRTAHFGTRIDYRCKVITRTN